MLDAIALFAKAAVPGRVKTRLTPPLTAGQAARLHARFVDECWRGVAAVPGVELYLFSDRHWPAYERLAAAARFHLQEGGSLGERMYRCFEALRTRGHRRALIVGSDSPNLPPELLSQALERLRCADAVLGPAEDGGYYAVGCRAPHPQMFAGVRWSAATTFDDTARAFERLGWCWESLPEWYDIDTADDLSRLLRDPLTPPALQEFLRELIESRGG